MKLTQLDYVIAAQRAGSFSRAARDCGITQAALSTAVATLEDELGEPIFTRTNVKLSVTPFGAEVLPLIEGVVAARDRLSQKVASLQAPSARRMLVGHSPLISSTLLRRLVPVLRSGVTGANVVLTEGNMVDLYDRLKARTIDLAVVPHGPATSAFRSLALETDPLCYMPRKDQSSDSTDAAGQEVVLRDVAAQTFLMVPDACGLALATRTLFSTLKLKLRAYEEQAMSYRSLEEWSLAGLGAAILPKSKVTEPDRALPLFLRRGEPAEIHYEALWLRANNRRLQPYVAVLRQTWVRGRFNPIGAT